MTLSNAPVPWRELIPVSALIASEDFAGDLPAPRVAAAIATGLRLGGAPEADLCPLAATEDDRGHDLRSVLGRLDFDSRLRRARALILATPAIEPHALQQTAAFELATRARQGGIPAYAILRRATLDLFEARMLDLQTILVASDEPALELAGARLATLL